MLGEEQVLEGGLNGVLAGVHAFAAGVVCGKLRATLKQMTDEEAAQAMEKWIAAHS